MYVLNLRLIVTFVAHVTLRSHETCHVAVHLFPVIKPDSKLTPLVAVTLLEGRDALV
jgi:hypothetical protein